MSSTDLPFGDEQPDDDSLHDIVPSNTLNVDDVSVELTGGTHIGNRDVVGIVRRGPLPMPHEFGEYERILPGAANRILTMAETSVAGRAAESERESNSRDFEVKLFWNSINLRNRN